MEYDYDKRVDARALQVLLADVADAVSSDLHVDCPEDSPRVRDGLANILNGVVAAIEGNQDVNLDAASLAVRELMEAWLPAVHDNRDDWRG